MNTLLVEDNIGLSLSDCKKYRYGLWREWNPDGKTCVVIGLSPSIEDEEFNNKKTLELVDFAKKLGCGRLVLMNLFSYIESDSSSIRDVTDPVGPQNNKILLSTCSNSDFVFSSWGDGKILNNRDNDLKSLFNNEVDLKIYK